MQERMLFQPKKGQGERKKKAVVNTNIKTVHFLNQQTKNHNKVGINHSFIKEFYKLQKPSFAIFVSFLIQLKLSDIETILNRNLFIFLQDRAICFNLNNWRSKVQPTSHICSPCVFINKVLLEHSHTHYLCIVYGYYCAPMAELNSCYQVHMTLKAKIFTTWSIIEKVC